MKGERYFSNLHVRDKVFWAKPKIAQVESNAKFILSLAEMQPIFRKDRSYFHTPLRTFRTTPHPSAAPFLCGRPKKRTKNETGATTDGRGDPLRKRSAADPPFGILSARRHRCGDGHAVSAGAQTYQPGAPDGHQDPAGAAARPARIPPRPEIRTRGPETAAKHRIPDLGLRPADAAVSGAGSPRGMASARFYHGVVPHPAEIGSHAAEHPFPYRGAFSIC